MMVNIKGDAVALWICDCSGDPARHVKSYNRSLYKKARGILLVFDITNRQSFEHVTDEYKLLSAQQKNKERSVVMLVGTKCDLEKDRQVSIHQAQRSIQGNCLCHILIRYRFVLLIINGVHGTICGAHVLLKQMMEINRDNWLLCVES
eukprot:467490_1